MFNFAVCGCGGMANWHAEELHKTGKVKIVALVDSVSSNADGFKHRHAPDAVVYESLQALMDKPPCPVDAIVIVTPHTLHYSQAKLALQHGLHVLCEKPMVTNTVDAYDLWRTAKQSGKLIEITYQSPYTANFVHLASARDNGELGRINAITGWISQGWLAATANTWRQDQSLSGGGFMYDTGAHLLNAIMWLMNDPVVEVACFIDNHNSPVDITGVAVMKFQNGATGSVTFAGNTPTFESDLTIFTDKLTVHTNAYGSKLEIFGKDRSWVEAKVDNAASQTPHANFIAALEGREPLRAPPRYGVLLSALMDAMYESGQTGQVVKVEPILADL